MTYQELIYQQPRIADTEPQFHDGLLLCANCGGYASGSMSVAVGWIGCSTCITGDAESFDDGDLVIEE